MTEGESGKTPAFTMLPVPRGSLIAMEFSDPETNPSPDELDHPQANTSAANYRVKLLLKRRDFLFEDETNIQKSHVW